MVFWGFCGWRCENTVLWPPKGTTLREFAYAGVSCVKVGSTAWALGPWKDFANKEEIIFWVVTLAIWGEVTPGAILTKCGMCVNMVGVITCAILGDCWLWGVGVARGVICPLLRYCPYNIGHTTVWPCDLTKNGGLGVEGENVKILRSNPCVNTRMLVYRMSNSVSRPEL